MQLLNKNQNKINWNTLTTNANAIPLFKEKLSKNILYLYYLGDLNSFFDNKNHLSSLSQNPNIFICV